MPRHKSLHFEKNEDLKKINSWLIRIREKNFLSQLDLSSKVGISATYLSLLENGHKVPSKALLWKIANIFGEKESLENILPETDFQSTNYFRSERLETNEFYSQQEIKILFELLKQKHSLSSGIFSLENVEEESLISFGLNPNSYILTERIDQQEHLTSGDLVVFDSEIGKHWAFVYYQDFRYILYFPSFIVQSALRATSEMMQKMGIQEGDEKGIPLDTLTQDVRVARLVLSLPPTSRQPLTTHPLYVNLDPTDREQIDILITRLTQDRKGSTSFQPTVRR